MPNIWERALAALRAKLPPVLFSDLERTVACVSIAANDESVTLQVAGPLQRDWIQESYLELLTCELGEQAHRPVRVEVVVKAKGRPGRVASPVRMSPTPAVAPAPAPPPAPVAAPPAPVAAPPAVTVSATPASCSVEPAPQPVTSMVLAPASALAVLPVESGVPVAEVGDEEMTERSRNLQLSARNTFASFVVGPANQTAYAASRGACQTPGRLYNPLYLYGPSGVGKTHLTQAVGHELAQARPELRVVYRTAEQFMNDYTRSLRNGKMDNFRRFYREQCDLLLIDDVQIFGTAQETQKEFFNTFEALFQRGVQMVLTSDRKPEEISQLHERLRTRFTWGMLADLQVPELETRVAILHKKAELLGMRLDEEVARFLAKHFRNDIRQLEGALNRLRQIAALSGGRTIDLEFAQEALKDQLPRTRPMTVDEAIKLVAERYRLRVADIRGDRRHRAVARPRQLAMWLVREALNLSYPEIGRAFGRDHTTVISACRRVEELRSTDPSFTDEAQTLLQRVENGEAVTTG